MNSWYESSSLRPHWASAREETIIIIKKMKGDVLFFASADFLNHDNMTVMLFSSQTLL
jgi:hypothetical protein